MLHVQYHMKPGNTGSVSALNYGANHGHASFTRPASCVQIKLMTVELKFLKDGRLLILLLETIATSHSSYCYPIGLRQIDSREMLFPEDHAFCRASFIN